MTKSLLKSMLVAGMLALGSSAWAQTAPTEGVEVTTGEFYIYNTASKTYLNRGSAYTTHATVDGAGSVITIAGPAGDYTLHFDGIAETSFLGNAGWVDCGTSREDYSTFTFEPATASGYTNAYKIKANKGGKYLNWNGGLDRWGNEAVIGDSNDETGCWILIPKATRQDISAASESNPVDVTYLVANPDIEGNAVDRGKATDSWKGTTDSNNFVTQFNNSEGMEAYFLERWVSSANNLGDFVASQTLTSLPTGNYRLSVVAAGVKQNDETVDPEGFILYAGEEETTIKALGTYSVEFKATGTDVVIGLKTVSCNLNWVRFDKVRLAYMGANLADLMESLNNLRETAEGLDGKIMSAAAQDDLTAALEATASVGATEQALKDANALLEEAIKKAKASIAAYKKVADFLPENKAELANTNVYDPNVYQELIVDVEEGYNDGSLSDEVANKLTSIKTGWRAANYIDDILMSAWDESVENWNSYHVNTWSIEGDSDGSNFLRPFIEYWTDDDKPLAAKTLTATLNDLEQGTYDVTALTRVRIMNGAEGTPTGISLQVNDGEAVDVTAGKQVGESQMYLDEFKATGKVGSNGELKIKYIVNDGNNVSWLAFKNVVYTLNTTVGINSVSEQQTKNATYNLAGQQVKQAQKGIFIVNGKKVVK